MAHRYCGLLLYSDHVDLLAVCDVRTAQTRVLIAKGHCQEHIQTTTSVPLSRVVFILGKTLLSVPPVCVPGAACNGHDVFVNVALAANIVKPRFN